MGGAQPDADLFQVVGLSALSRMGAGGCLQKQGRHRILTNRDDACGSAKSAYWHPSGRGTSLLTQATKVAGAARESAYGLWLFDCVEAPGSSAFVVGLDPRTRLRAACATASSGAVLYRRRRERMLRASNA
jgi:hypothetical protein